MTAWPGPVQFGWAGLIPRKRIAGFVLILSVLVAQAASANKLSLWEIRTHSATLYLLGSIHAVTPDLYPLPAPMESAFRASDTIVFEVDMTKVSADEIARDMRDRGRYAASESLDQALQPETAKALHAWLDKRGIPFASVAHIRPWLLSIQLEMAQLERLGYRPELGIDEYFLKRAKREGKQVRQLESWQQQLDLLADNPPAVQDAELRATIAELPSTEVDIRQLVAAWRKGDANRLFRLSMKAEENYPALRAWFTRMTVARNRRMAAKIRGYLTEGGHWLVIVGVLHMGGPQGLIDLLGQDFVVHQLDSASDQANRDAIPAWRQ